MKNNKSIPVIFSLLFLSLFFGQHLTAWQKPMKIAGPEAGDYFDYTTVRFNSQNHVYVLYKAGTQIHLSKYDGKNIIFVKNVSESRQLCYAPFMVMTASDEIHVIWAECSTYDSDTQYVKYRYFNGSWSPVINVITMNIPGSLPGGYTTRKIDTMRLAMDSRKNLFIVFQTNPATKSFLVSRYGSETILDPWVVTNRHKFPDVAADDNSIHVVWQDKLSGTSNYSIKYARKVNARHGAWSNPIDVKNNRNLENSSHLPRITLDNYHNPHVVYMDDDPAGHGRNVFCRYLAGSQFSERFLVSTNGKAYYSNLGISIFNTNQMIVMDHVTGGIRYNWKVAGNWTGHENISPMVDKPDCEAVDLNRTGQIAAVSCVSDREEVYLILSEGDGPVPPPPPPPPPPPNVAPKAKFSFAPASGLYPLTVSFNANASTDSDGKIVSYKWNFGDRGTGSGATIQHTFTSKSSYIITLTVTDDDGATASASGEVVVLGIVPPLNVQFKRLINRNLFSIEYLYRVTWNPNPENEAVGAKIVAYKIYRRPKGLGGFAFFTQVAAGNQSTFEYLDRTIGREAKEFDYVVSCVDSGGRESDWN